MDGCEQVQEGAVCSVWYGAGSPTHPVAGNGAPLQGPGQQEGVFMQAKVSEAYSTR